MQLADLYRRALDFEFLGIEEGMHLFEHAPLSDLMHVADELRKRGLKWMISSLPLIQILATMCNSIKTCCRTQEKLFVFSSTGKAN